ncbi:hypothetical protein PPERSA_04251 [Pseudocohnilembus persalinus]|uniref:GAF domain-containing protein n=1 Tax=Pseudocohnilembus persalinus TaxID=266149 RepID=A0A0V0QN41_PSEPJ|nr:hypothetical protein PPERSA_04251 [Pseudocohnilembus persalinus]|eukprot:KRX03743.1 hypothetical protein PPERSA_04251 [Pseudocohnilembus persalinus]
MKLRPQSAKTRSVSNQISNKSSGFQANNQLNRGNSRPQSGRTKFNVQMQNQIKNSAKKYPDLSLNNSQNYQEALPIINDFQKMNQNSGNKYGQEEIKQDLYIERLSLKNELNKYQKENKILKTKIQQLSVMEKNDGIQEIKDKVRTRREELKFLDLELKELQKMTKFTDMQEEALKRRLAFNKTKEIREQIENELLRQQIIEIIYQGQIEQIDDIFLAQSEELFQHQQELQQQYDDLINENNYWKVMPFQQNYNNLILCYQFQNCFNQASIKEKNGNLRVLEKHIRDRQIEISQIQKEEKKLNDYFNELKLKEKERQESNLNQMIQENIEHEQEAILQQINELEKDINQKNAEITDKSQEIDIIQTKCTKEIKDEQDIQETLQNELNEINKINKELEESYLKTPQLRQIVVKNKKVFEDVKKKQNHLNFEQKTQLRRHSISHIIQDSYIKVAQKLGISPQKGDKMNNDDSIDEVPKSRKRTNTQDQFIYSATQQNSHQNSIYQQNVDEMKITEGASSEEESPLKYKQKQQQRQQFKDQLEKNQQLVKKHKEKINQELKLFGQQTDKHVKNLNKKETNEQFIRIQARMDDIDDEQLLNAQSQISSYKTFPSLINACERQIMKLFDTQDARVYFFDKEINKLIRYNSTQQKQSYKTDAGICGYVFENENYYFIVNNYSHSHFNPIIDIDTQMPVVCFPLFAVDTFQNQIKIGVVQCIDPKGINTLIKQKMRNQEELNDKLNQKIQNFGRIIAQQMYILQLKNKQEKGEESPI